MEQRKEGTAELDIYYLPPGAFEVRIAGFEQHFQFISGSFSLHGPTQSWLINNLFIFSPLTLSNHNYNC